MQIDLQNTEDRRSLQQMGRCVACGVESTGTYGKRDEQDWLPCCEECYIGGKLRVWLDKHGENAPTEKLTDSRP